MNAGMTVLRKGSPLAHNDVEGPDHFHHRHQWAPYTF